MKLKTLIKSLEFILVVGATIVFYFLNGIQLIPAIVIAGGYIALNLTGWATKTPSDVVSGKSIPGGGISQPTGGKSIPGGGISKPTGGKKGK